MSTAETSICKAAAGWLERQGMTVYQEVRGAHRDQRADLVGELAGQTLVVEAKTRLSLELIDQAHGWIPYANQVAVAVPARKGRWDRLPHVVLRQLGIGCLAVSKADSKFPQVKVHTYPRWRRVKLDELAVVSCLHTGQRTECEAGSRGGGFWTPWKATMREVATFVRSNPGCSVSELMAHVDEHHYSTAANFRRGVVRALGEGWIEGVTGVRVGKAWRLWPAD